MTYDNIDSDGDGIIDADLGDGTQSVNVSDLDVQTVSTGKQNGVYHASFADSDLPNITDAIADASEGDKVVIAPGDHTGEGVISVDKTITLAGAGNQSTDTGIGPGGTILAGVDLATDAQVRGVVLKDFSIENGALQIGDEASDVGASRPKLERVSVHGDGTQDSLVLENTFELRAYNCEFLIGDRNLVATDTFNSQLEFYGCEFNQASQENVLLSGQSEVSFFGGTIANAGVSTPSPEFILDASSGVNASVGIYNTQIEKQSSVISGSERGIYCDGSAGNPASKLTIRNIAPTGDITKIIDVDEVVGLVAGPFSNASSPITHFVDVRGGSQMVLGPADSTANIDVDNSANAANNVTVLSAGAEPVQSFRNSDSGNMASISTTETSTPHRLRAESNNRFSMFNGSQRVVETTENGGSGPDSQDLSQLSMSFIDDGLFFSHDGTGTIDADGETTSAQGIYVYSDADNEFKSVVQF